MAASTFKEALTLVLAHEGGYVNHPRDPGGATNKGVTQRVYDAYRKVNGLAAQSVKGISNGEAAAIYKQQYWNAVVGDKLPAGVDYAVFDFAVNSGVARANRYLQLAIGFKGGDVDGHLGNKTMAALMDADAAAVVIKLCADRMAFLKSLGTFETFGKGWTRRVVGSVAGYQQNDHGVIDYGVNFAKAGDKLKAPVFIGGKVDEPQTAKATNDNLEVMPTVAGPVSYEAAKASGWGR